MKTRTRNAVPLLLLFALAHIAFAQSRPEEKGDKPTGSISGRVRIGDKPAPGIAIVLATIDFGPNRKSIAQATTDADGRFQLFEVPAGAFNVMPLAPVYVARNEANYGQPGKTVNVAVGEQIEGVDFTLMRGGVITGRVADADGHPVIEERVDLTPIDEANKQRQSFPFNYYMYQTDDRGVYRIYGLPAGRYKVSVGQGKDSQFVSVGNARAYYQRTFHPDVTDEAKAEPAEVTAGGEVANVDITVGHLLIGHQVSGRITDEKGEPAASVMYGYGTLRNEGKAMGALGWGFQTNSQGEFTIENLLPGRYAVFAASEIPSESYGEPVAFDITDSDVSGLEIKLRRGGSINGMAVIEGTDDKAVSAKLSQLQLRVSVSSQSLSPPSLNSINIGSDGSFRIGGLSPGKVRLYIWNFGRDVPKGFLLRRIERDGVEQRDGIEVAAGEKVTGVRVVLAYGTGIVRGQVKIEGGTLSEDSRLTVRVLRPGDRAPLNMRPVEVDSRGRFVIEGLAAGEYELALDTYLPGTPSARRPLSVKQSIVVADGVESDVTMILDLAAREKEGAR